jgi:hypothetical protein
MAESCGAQFVSLHVRESNVAALRLYRDTLGFKVVETVAKYYADGEDAYSMKMDLGYVREEALDEEEEAQDEGEPVGSEGKKEEGEKPRKMKVKVGRGLGVGDLVERNEAKA